MVYVTDRNGVQEIGLHKPGQPDRPLVTSRDFPPDKTRGFMGPALSPDGTRVIYKWLVLAGRSALWMSAVAGGQPVSLLKSDESDDNPDTWFTGRQLVRLPEYDFCGLGVIEQGEDDRWSRSTTLTGDRRHEASIRRTSRP